MRNYYYPLDTSHENITFFLAVFGFPECREGEVPPALVYHTHNIEWMLLKQWHLRIGYTDRAVSFNAF